MLYRLAETLDAQDRASAAASLARVLIAAGRVDQARPYALDGNDPVLVARLLLEGHDFAQARRLLDEARQRDPFDPRIASARGRLAFLEKRFGEAVGDLLEAALLRSDGLPDATDRRFLRAARALAPDQIPGWKEAVGAARDRLAAEAARRAPGVEWPDRSARAAALAHPPRLRVAGGRPRAARRLAELPALQGLDESALFSAAAAGELRRLATGSPSTARARPPARSRSSCRASLELVRPTPVGDQPMGEAQPGDFVGEEALVGLAAHVRRAGARRRDAARLHARLLLPGAGPRAVAAVTCARAWPAGSRA